MPFSTPNRLKRSHIDSGSPENNSGLAFQNTRVYRKAGYEVDAEVRVVGVGGVLLIASQRVDDGELLELVSLLSGINDGGLGESATTKVCSSGEGGMQISVTGPAQSVGLINRQHLTPRNFGQDSGLVILIPEGIDSERIETAVSMALSE
jgi:hypothetical protein